MEKATAFSTVKNVAKNVELLECYLLRSDHTVCGKGGSLVLFVNPLNPHDEIILFKSKTKINHPKYLS